MNIRQKITISKTSSANFNWYLFWWAKKLQIDLWEKLVRFLNWYRIIFESAFTHVHTPPPRSSHTHPTPAMTPPPTFTPLLTRSPNLPYPPPVTPPLTTPCFLPTPVWRSEGASKRGGGGGGKLGLINNHGGLGYRNRGWWEGGGRSWTNCHSLMK